MLRGSTPGIRRERQHGAVLEQCDRRDLERAGWRTTLDYRENLIRARDGRLLQVEPVWHAEAERSDAGRSASSSRIVAMPVLMGVAIIAWCPV